MLCQLIGSGGSGGLLEGSPATRPSIAARAPPARAAASHRLPPCRRCGSSSARRAKRGSSRQLNLRCVNVATMRLCWHATSDISCTSCPQQPSTPTEPTVARAVAHHSTTGLVWCRSCRRLARRARTHGQPRIPVHPWLTSCRGRGRGGSCLPVFLAQSECLATKWPAPPAAQSRCVP